MSNFLTIITLTLLSLLIPHSLSSPSSPHASFCAHVKEADPEVGLWLKCDDICTPMDLTYFHSIDVDDAVSCTLYDDPYCKIDPSHTAEVIKGPQVDWELTGKRSAYKCGRVAVEGRSGWNRAVSEKARKARNSPLRIAVGYLKEYASGTSKSSLTLIGDSTCNEIVEARDYQYITLFSDSRCALYIDTACNVQMGDDFTGPLQGVKFESGDTLKSYKCEALEKSEGI